MSGSWVRRIVAVGVWTLLAVGLSAPAAARQSEARPVGAEFRARVPQAPTELDQQRAEVTREELRELMRRYPPALSRVLKLDPTLMANTAYLAPYPALSTYLQRHPEVARYPDYFLDFVDNYYSEPVPPEIEMRRNAINAWRDLFFAVFFFAGFLTAAFSIGWLIRYVVGHRRWLRTVKVQSDVHGRLMERFSSNDELMAYVQSPAGRQFLQGLPAAAPETPNVSSVAAPLTRILWSVQAGVVLVCGGTGFLVIKPYFVDEVAEMLLVWGVIGVALGIGFILAAGASYILSVRFGLFDAAQNGGSKGA